MPKPFMPLVTGHTSLEATLGQWGNSVMLVPPRANHFAALARFISLACAAAKLAASAGMVSLGIAPDQPETSYGYIRVDLRIGEAGLPSPLMDATRHVE